jgi:putative phosphoribosyl transferase
LIFSNRIEAGRKLATKLADFAGDKSAIVLASPRGGVVVGYEVAHKLGLPLDIIIPRKIGAPSNPELAIGAVTEDGTAILNDRLVGYLNVSQTYLKEESERQRQEIKRRLKLYRGSVPYPGLSNRSVIIVDDGVATGATIEAALASLRKKKAKMVVIAVPVGPRSTVGELEAKADRVVCLFAPEDFYAIGQFYEDFSQTTDEEVISLLKRVREEVDRRERST